MDQIERYEGSDGHVYLIEYVDNRYIARVFAGDVYVAGQFTGEIAPDMSNDKTIRAFALQAIEEKIRAARESRGS
ncbi:MAG: hypothetical protein M3Y55_17915 [Pseudomonadota bacterium]|nr:hypothetical protein [Pseudomonadota bacterium]